MSGQVRSGSGASWPHTYFKQQIHKNIAVLSYLTDILFEILNDQKFCFIYEINQAKIQGLALHRLENSEIKM